MNEHQYTFTDMLIMMHRFGIVLYTYSSPWTFQVLTILVFTNSIAFEDIFLVREPLELGNDENVEVLFKISIGSYWTLPMFK